MSVCVYYRGHPKRTFSVYMCIIVIHIVQRSGDVQYNIIYYNNDDDDDDDKKADDGFPLADVYIRI